MTERLTVRKDGRRVYDIAFSQSFDQLAEEMRDLSPETRKVCVVTDSNVARLHLQELSEKLAPIAGKLSTFVFPAGEEHKTLDTVRELYEHLIREGFDRKDLLVAFGGGVVGDLTGFTAATYLRGIDFIQIPTTLLSQVDSSIGGKTAIDLGKIKNIIGAFHQPKKVIIDPDVLSTLPDRHIKNGLAECIKMGLCLDERLFDIFRSDRYMDDIDIIIELSLRAKKRVVEEDEKETGLRKVLNFGHTIGHAIEASLPFGELYHGECVALGMLPFCADAIKDEVTEAIKKCGLPYEYTIDRKKVRDIIIHDKKSLGEKISVVKCDEIGSFYFEEMTADEIMNLI